MPICFGVVISLQRPLWGRTEGSGPQTPRLQLITAHLGVTSNMLISAAKNPPSAFRLNPHNVKTPNQYTAFRKAKPLECAENNTSRNAYFISKSPIPLKRSTAKEKYYSWTTFSQYCHLHLTLIQSTINLWVEWYESVKNMLPL